MRKSLLALAPGEKGLVVQVGGEEPLQRRLSQMGLVPGSEIMTDRVAPLGDPRSYVVMGYRISLRNQEAAIILIDSHQQESLS